MKKVIYSLIFLTAIVSCSQMKKDKTKSENEFKNSASMESLTYLALGDSYTIGERVKESERWPVQLTEKGRNDGYLIDNPTIIAKTGWTTDELQDGIRNAQIDDQSFDFVSLLIGVNNQYRGYDLNTYEIEFASLLRQAISFAGGDNSSVFVLSIPDYGVTPFASKSDINKISKEIDLYNNIAKAISDGLNVQYFDITGISREAEDDLSLVTDDGLHPSGKMYQKWVDKEVYTWFEEKIKP